MKKLPKSLTTVTTFSKTLAMILFILMPLLGFQIGTEYQKQQTPVKTEIKTIPKLIYQTLVETDNDLIRRCGDLVKEDFKLPRYDRFSVVSSPSWAPDCRHAALSVWQSGPSWEGPTSVEATISSEYTGYIYDGIYLYDDKTKLTKKIYAVKSGSETPVFKKWADAETVIFTVSQQLEEVDYSYNINTKQLFKIED